MGTWRIDHYDRDRHRREGLCRRRRPATAALLNGPFDIAFDVGGNRFFSDTFNQRVRRVDAASGIITTVAGNGEQGYGGDGGPAIAASLNEPYGIVLDRTGNLFIATD